MSTPASDASRPASQLGAPESDRRTMIGDVALLACVGVVPHLLQCVSFYASPNESSASFVGQSITIIAYSLPSIAAAGYVMVRSREGPAAFGLKKPHAGIDLGLGLLLFALALVVERSLAYPLLALLDGVGLVRDSEGEGLFTPARGAWQHALVVPTQLSNAAGEELILCALNVRLAHLLRNRVAAVVIVALAFASYHLYQGVYSATLIFFGGLIQQTAFIATRRVWPNVLSHAAMNTVIWWSASGG